MPTLSCIVLKPLLLLPCIGLKYCKGLLIDYCPRTGMHSPMQAQALPAPSIAEDSHGRGRHPRPHPFFSPDFLSLILERIDLPLTLAHISMHSASTSCRALWRRVVADTGFLRHFRSVHGPKSPATTATAATSSIQGVEQPQATAQCSSPLRRPSIWPPGLDFLVYDGCERISS